VATMLIKSKEFAEIVRQNVNCTIDCFKVWYTKGIYFVPLGDFIAIYTNFEDVITMEV
jgi:hypothetical protein